MRIKEKARECMSVYVCVRVKEKERERETVAGKREK